MKTCNKCGIEKDLSCFGKNKVMKDGLHSSCKECINRINREFSKNNPQAKKEYSVRWARKNKAKKSAYDKQWQQKNKAKVVAYVRHRQTAKLQRTPKWLTKEHLRQIEIEYKLAEWCTLVTGEDYQVDHIVPLRGKTVSGLHVPWNLQVITKAANVEKSNKWQS